MERTILPVRGKLSFYHIIALFTITLFSQPRLGYCEVIEKYSSVLIVIRTADSDKDPGLEQVAAEALQVELERRGLTVSLQSDISAFDGLSEAGLDELSAAAQAEGFGLLGVCEYQTLDRDIQIVLSMYDLENPEIYSTVAKKGRVDLSVDILFSDAVRDCVSMLEEKIPGLTMLQQNIPPPDESGED